MTRLGPALLLGLCLVACESGGSNMPSAETGSMGTVSGGSTGGDATGTGSSGTSSSSGGSASSGPTSSSSGGTDSSGGSTGGVGDGVCERWISDRAELSEGTWSGDVGTCDPGDISADGRANALRLVNLYRWIADLPPVVTDPTRDGKAQACALMMDANGQLSHDPPMSWTCWSADGAEAAGMSNIAGGPGVMAVDLYMADTGNATTLGHRRWILSNTLGPVGIGSTPGGSCMWVLGGAGAAGKAWMAWPPPGPFPVQAVAPLGWASMDEAGWSLQSDSIDLAGAQVQITRDGQPLAVNVTNLQQGYGSKYAISMVPSGWSTEVGIYQVEVTGLAQPISYEVEVVECGG